ncbi:MAG: ATP-binding protein [Burkholderiales bacterium]|nr:ATP-binding protein [Burkholderiales bacterium]
MFLKQIKFKVSLFLAIALAPAMVLFPYMIVQYQREHLQQEISRHVVQLSEVIVKSTRYAMMLNQQDMTEKIIQDVGRQKGIERVRVISKDGTIIHSSDSSEVGYSVEQSDEPCVHCHLSATPLTQLPDEKRWKVFTAASGHRVLEAMHPINNEASCSSASCHEHRANQAVLGIVDIAYSLEDVDKELQLHSTYLALVSIGGVLLVAVCIGLLMQRLIYLPLKDLETGAKRIALGDLEHNIPVRSDDDFGHVAGSFNHMTVALKNAMSETQELVHTLEAKVQEKTHELQVAQAEVAQGEKLAAIGLLASGIAHELNNPLTGVLTFTSLLRKKMPDGSPDAEDLDLVIRETKRCAAIIRRLLDFAREKVPVKGFFNLNQLIEDTVHFVDRPASLQQVDISTELDPELPAVWGDADLIKQVLLNVIVNAEQAIEGQGQVRISSRRHLSKAPAVAGLDPVPMVEVAVQDTGCGIPEANLQRIFDPFFTSKEVGKGTGLGLSVSYGIIKSHGGGIKVESVVGTGTTFRIYLPVEAPHGETQRKTGESTP